MAVDVATKYWFCNPPPPSQCIGYNIYIICIWYDNYMLDKLKGWHSSPVLLKVQVCLSVKPCWYLPCRLEWRLRQLKTAALGNTTGWTLPAEISRNKHIRDTTPPHTSPHIHTTPHHITLTAPQIKGQDYKDYKTTTWLTNAFTCRDIRHVFWKVIIQASVKS